MSTPWLDVPLADYEGHMSAAGVEQLTPLAELFQLAIAHARPASVAVLGVAGGNGLDRIDPQVTSHVIGFDINRAYLQSVAARFPHVELHCADLARETVSVPSVELVHAALILEHAGTGRCLDNAVALIQPGGWLSVVLQLPSDSQAGVAPTPFPSIQTLKEIFQFVDPIWLTDTLAARGLRLESETRHPLPSGKAFWLGIFRSAS
jgi:hypothetical protein